MVSMLRSEDQETYLQWHAIIVRLFLVFMIFTPGVSLLGQPGVNLPGKDHSLIEIVRLDSTIHLDIRYATTNNFTGRSVYTQPRAFFQRPVAEALVRVNRTLRAKGYGLLIFDGYRPWSVTKFFWDIASEKQRKAGFVANPSPGSKHNRGCSADLSLYDLANGKEVTMPSLYDEFSLRAYSDYTGGSRRSRQLRYILRSAMEREGFRVANNEWWHFDYRDWPKYPVMNVPFDSL
jgi:D-alanyl-D-alanine dipeptidase